jgi:hypothetical protein
MSKYRVLESDKHTDFRDGNFYPQYLGGFLGNKWVHFMEAGGEDGVAYSWEASFKTYDQAKAYISRHIERNNRKVLEPKPEETIHLYP